MISAIICTYNREKYILDCLTHLQAAAGADQNAAEAGQNASKAAATETAAAAAAIQDALEVIVVDNNSTDGTATLVKAFLEENPDFPGRYVLETRQGLSNARNRGIAEAKGDVLVFLDDDALVCPQYMDRLREALDANPQAGAFGGAINPVFEDGITPKWLCRWTNSWVSGLDMGSRIIEFPKNKYPIGANMGFRRSVIDACSQNAEAFNPNLGRSGGNLIGGEEKDLFQRVHAAGHSVLYFPEVKVDHVIPPSRTTKEYVRRFADGVGRSERIRTKGDGTYARRLLSEAVKWCATLALLFVYLITLRPACGAMLVLFRFRVTRNLLSAAE